MKLPVLLLLVATPLGPLGAQRPPRPARRPSTPRPAVAPQAAEPPEPPSADDWAPAIAADPFPIETPFPLETPMALESSWSLAVPFPPEPALAPLGPEGSWDQAPAPVLGEALWSPSADVWAPFGTERVPAFARQAPDDSLYRMAREALNRGEYHRAAELFAQFESANPSSRYVAASMYWRAFARYRAGREDDLRTAVKVLDEQRRRFPEAGDDADVRVLFTRVMGALAARGDTDAVRRLREGADQGDGQSDQPCDREEMDVRAEALSALAGTDPGSVSGVITRVLADRDECSEPLRRRAIYLLGKTDDAAAQQALLDAAQNDPSVRVRSDAIARLAQLPGDRQVPLLTQLMAGSNDENTQLAVVDGLRRSEDPAAHRELRRIIERDDLSERVRVGALRSLVRGSWTPFAGTVTAGPQIAGPVKGRGEGPAVSADDADYLKGLYGRVQAGSIKFAIVETMARYGGDGGDAWLMTLARDPSQDTRFRSAALQPPPASRRECGRAGQALRHPHRPRAPVDHGPDPGFAVGARGNRQAARHRPPRHRSVDPPASDQRPGAEEGPPDHQAAPRAGGEVSRRPLGLLTCLLLAACAESADAQGLGRRLEGGPDGLLAVRFAARSDVCGSATLLRIGSGTWFGDSEWSYSRNSGMGGGTCDRLPAEVLMTRADGRIVAIRVGLAGASLPPGTTDLGVVPSGDAGRAFLDLAARLDGRAGREALLAAAVADSAPTWRDLLELVNNDRVSRGLRESAAGWLGRELVAAESGAAAAIGRALARVARDHDAPISVRTRAVSSLAGPLGRPPAELVTLAGSDEPAIAKAALAGLGRATTPAPEPCSAARRATPTCRPRSESRRFGRWATATPRRATSRRSGRSGRASTARPGARCSRWSPTPAAVRTPDGCWRWWTTRPSRPTTGLGPCGPPSGRAPARLRWSRGTIG